MLAAAVFMPNDHLMPAWRNRDKFRMRHVNLTIVRQDQLERLERPGRHESFYRRGIHAATMTQLLSLSIRRSL